MPIISALPFSLTNGTTADATQVMADFNQIFNNVNANAAGSGTNSDITALTQLTTISHAFSAVSETITSTFTMGTSTKMIIDGDNAALNSRFAFQTITANAVTSVEAIPNGTGAGAQYALWSGTDRANAALGALQMNAGTNVAITSSKTGTGTTLPLVFSVGGTTAISIAAATAAVTVGPATGGATPLTVSTVSAGVAIDVTDGTVNGHVGNFAGTTMQVGTTSNHPMNLFTNGAARVTVSASGGVTIAAPIGGTNTLTLGNTSSVGVSVLVLNCTAGGTNAIAATDGTVSFGLFLNGSGGVALNVSTAHQLELRTNNTAAIRISGSDQSVSLLKKTTTQNGGGFITQINDQSGNTAYTLALGDAGGSVLQRDQVTGLTVTIPANATVAFDLGTTIRTIAAQNAVVNTLTIAAAGGVTVINGVGAQTHDTIQTFTKVLVNTWIKG